VGLSAVGLLSFSQAISLSLLNDKKKVEGRRRVGGEVVSKEKRWERRKKKKEEGEIRKKKSNVLGCRIILYIFFSFM
jgi:hypothetical protein